ncbi:MAG: NADH-quinone oxidoreductase subunit J [Bdellovibrionota bacterium]
MELSMMPIVFYVLSGLLLLSGLGVILVTSPIYSALFLSITMLLLSAIFFVLEAYFLAAIQLMVYAGAVVVLFVMVLMMFDLRKEKAGFSGNWATNVAKTLISLVSLVILLTPVFVFFNDAKPAWLDQAGLPTQDLSLTLFARHVFTFEVIGVLLLVVLVGSVTLAKSKGGTHAKHH